MGSVAEAERLSGEPIWELREIGKVGETAYRVAEPVFGDLDKRRNYGWAAGIKQSDLARGSSPGFKMEGINMIDRRTFSSMVIAGVATSYFGRSSEARAHQGGSARNVVLVHGAYADGSCWSEVIGRLQRIGLKATAVQNPLTSLADDVAATRRILALQDGPTVLVGHSWAGTVISEAGVDPKVSALVYVAARAPDAGEDYAALAAKFPTPPANAGLVKAGASPN